MKNFFLTGLLLCYINLCYSQTENETGAISKRNSSQNELSINAFNLVAFGIIDIAYERVINESSTWSIEGFYHPSDEEYIDDAYYKDFSLTGKYKHFFSSTYARGFYVHGFGMFSIGEYETGYFEDDFGGEYETEDYSDFAIGFGLGGKFVSTGGFMLDLNTGIGRNLFNNKAPEIIGQFMVNLGYRF